MEQQNQQPNQQLNKISIDEQKRQKSKRIKIALLALAAVLTVVGGIFLLQRFQEEVPTPQPQAQDIIPPQVRKSFATQEECELQTGYRCDFVNCDVNCPIGFQKGWSATDTKLEREEIDTSTWQTYRPEEFGFEVKYPRDWIAEGPPNPTKPSRTIIGFRNPILLGSSIEILKNLNPMKLSLDKWLEEWTREVPVKAAAKPSLLNGIPAYRLDSASKLSFEIYIASQDNQIFTIIGGSKNSEGAKIIDQILSTFRFVDFVTEVPPGYDANVIDVKFKYGTKVDPAIEALPHHLQTEVKQMERLTNLPSEELQRIGASQFELWFRIQLKESIDPIEFMNDLRSSHAVESADFVPKPQIPPNLP